MHLVLSVTDVDRAKEFYCDAFGWQPHLEWPGEYAELQLPDNDWLGLYREDGFAASAGMPVDELKRGRYAGAELYVQVEDLQDAMDSLRKAGAKSLSPWLGVGGATRRRTSPTRTATSSPSHGRSTRRTARAPTGCGSAASRACVRRTP